MSGRALSGSSSQLICRNKYITCTISKVLSAKDTSELQSLRVLLFPRFVYQVIQVTFHDFQCKFMQNYTLLLSRCAGKRRLSQCSTVQISIEFIHSIFILSNVSFHCSIEAASLATFNLSSHPSTLKVVSQKRRQPLMKFALGSHGKL